MATPVLESFTLDGSLGPIAVDVRAQTRTAPRPAVLILHGFKGFKDWGMFPPFAERLARSGVTAVTCNVSGSGMEGDRVAYPERFSANTFSRELDDILAVLRALREGALGVASPPRLGLVGHSRGGGLAVLAAARDAAVSSLVTWAGISTVERWDAETVAQWRRRGGLEVLNSRTGDILTLAPEVLDDVEAHAGGALDIGSAAARLAIPWLMVQGTADPAVSVAEAERLHAAQPNAELLLLDEAGHTFGTAHPWRGSTPHFDRTMEATIRWFARTLA